MKYVDRKDLFRAILFVFAYIVVLPIVISAGFSIFGLSLEKDINYLAANLLIYGISLLFLIFYYRKSLKEELTRYLKHFKEFFKVALRSWGKAFIFMVVTNLFIVSLTGGIADNESANRDIISMYPLFSVITMIFIGPFIEEILFRKNFKSAFKNKKSFLFFSAFAFGAAHVFISIDFSSLEAFLECLPDLLFIIPYAGMGYFFAEAYYETDSIFTSTTTHMLHNTLAVFVSIFGAMYV